ncbi:MAG: PepSY domain-containing protein [Rubrivivax sp.]|jgi:hypothetical protein|nr:PepSY domain-containing protein [Rubrivivax sp.]MDP3224184.1 PepSY domain-containing protein [Rubrivivax sp.]MDP3615967.1 PepSY domain-containing protein [Rubrivivax sp.]
MRATTLIATLALTGGLFAAGAALVPAFAQNAPAAAASQSAGMSTQAVQTKLAASGYRDFEKFERKRDRYEVKATDPKGQRVELYVDPFTGDIVKSEVKRRK